MDFATLLIFAGALLIAAGSPGPSIAALVARVIARGPGDVMPFLSAMWIGEALWLSAAVFGLAAIAEQLSTLFLIIKWLGVFYLFFLAWKMWTTPVSDTSGAALPPPKTPPLKMFGTGLALTLGNPKIMVFYLALLPSLIDLSTLTVFGWAELVLVMLAVLILIDLAWVMAAHQARRLLQSPRAVKISNRISATLLGGAATAVALRQ